MYTLPLCPTIQALVADIMKLRTYFSPHLPNIRTHVSRTGLTNHLPVPLLEININSTVPSKFHSISLIPQRAPPCFLPALIQGPIKFLELPLVSLVSPIPEQSSRAVGRVMAPKDVH